MQHKAPDVLNFAAVRAAPHQIENTVLPHFQLYITFPFFTFFPNGSTDQSARLILTHDDSNDALQSKEVALGSPVIAPNFD
jgi:hypothetical protein